MVTHNEAVRLWEDNVGDSGEAPTGYELHVFANAVRVHSMQPLVDLAEGWTKRATALEEKAAWLARNGPTSLSEGMLYRVRAYRYLASEVLGTISPKD
jgi:hypothetical protein